MSRCVIVGGAEISNYKKIKKYLKNDDFFIFCDCGLRHAERLQVIPDLIVGDFDSYEKPSECSCETIILPREKDDTDSAYGVREGLKRGFDDFVLTGMLGQRFDHTLVNISLLLKLKKSGKKAILIDDYSDMQILEAGSLAVPDTFSYFSVVSLSSELNGVTITGAKYPLSDAMIKADTQYATSNEVLPQKKALITVKQGTALVIRVF